MLHNPAQKYVPPLSQGDTCPQHCLHCVGRPAYTIVYDDKTFPTPKGLPPRVFLKLHLLSSSLCPLTLLFSHFRFSQKWRSIIYLFVSCFFPPGQFHEGRKLCLFYSRLHTQRIKQEEAQEIVKYFFSIFNERLFSSLCIFIKLTSIQKLKCRN